MHISFIIALFIIISGFIVPILTENISHKSIIIITKKSSQLKILVTEHLQNHPTLKIFSIDKSSNNQIHQVSNELI